LITSLTALEISLQTFAIEKKKLNRIIFLAEILCNHALQHKSDYIYLIKITDSSDLTQNLKIANKSI